MKVTSDILVQNAFSTQLKCFSNNIQTILLHGNVSTWTTIWILKIQGHFIIHSKANGSRASDYFQAHLLGCNAVYNAKIEDENHLLECNTDCVHVEEANHLIHSAMRTDHVQIEEECHSVFQVNVSQFPTWSKSTHSLKTCQCEFSSWRCEEMDWKSGAIILETPREPQQRKSWWWNCLFSAKARQRTPHGSEINQYRQCGPHRCQKKHGVTSVGGCCSFFLLFA